MKATAIGVGAVAVVAVVAAGILLAGNSGTDKRLTISQSRLAAPGGESKSIAVASQAISAGQPIDRRYSSYGENIAPDLAWSLVPPRAQSVAVLVEDPDAPVKKPFVHWVIYNIPPDTHGLPGGSATGGALLREAKAGRLNTALEGTNDTGTIGWYGPHPPQGDPAHHYHFEIFALDRMLPLLTGASRDAVEAAMVGHVVAKGEFVATYAEK